MSNSQITSQLTRVTVPSISDGKFADGIKNAFETINNNFKTIASLPFIQGVQGDSYTLISKDIWVKVNDIVSPVHYALTKEGAVLLNSIFESFFQDKDDTDVKKFQEGDSFDECKTNKLGGLILNGVSPLDSFFTEEIEEDKPVKKLVNNKLYFYSVINNLDEEQDTYLGQYFYFIDYRITELGNAYQNKNLSEFIDFTGFYQYQPASETEQEKYNVISIVPNLYYDKYKDDICWKYNGQETGISAIGPKGLDGKDANFKIVYVQDNNITNNSGGILGYFDSTLEDIVYTDKLEDCFCLIQFVSTTDVNDKPEITGYVDSAFGEVHSNNVYWEDEYRISKLFNNQNITRYFCSMGVGSSIENHPYYFAIPAYLDRSDATKDDYKVGHVFSGSEGGNLILQKANNAFTESGGQTGGSLNQYNGTQSNIFDIVNYNVDVDKDLSVGGTLEVSGTGTFNKDLSVGGTLGVIGNATFNNDLSVKRSATIRNGATIYGKETQPGGIGLTVSGGIGVTGTDGGTGVIIKGGDSREDDGGVGLVVRGGTSLNGNGKIGLGLKVETGGAEISDDLSVGGTLSVTNTVTNDLTVNNTANIKTLEVTDNATVTNDLTVTTGDLTVTTGDLTVEGTASVGTLNVDNATVTNDLTVTTGDLTVKGTASVGTLNVDNATVTNDLTVTTGNLTVSTGDLTVEGTASVGTLNVEGSLTCSGTFSVEQASSHFGGNIHMIDGGNLTAYLDNANISENLSVYKRLVINYSGVNDISNPSEIRGRYANNFSSGTSHGGIGLIIRGGSGRETNEAYQGNGGVGLEVYGGSAGNYIGSTSSHAGYGGTGLVVYGGQAGPGPGTSNTGHTGSAIKTYGDIIIGDSDGNNTTKLSSSASEFKISRKTTLNSGATINSGAKINGGATINSGALSLLDGPITFPNICATGGNNYTDTGFLMIEDEGNGSAATIRYSADKYPAGSIAFICPKGVNCDIWVYTGPGTEDVHKFVNDNEIYMLIFTGKTYRYGDKTYTYPSYFSLLGNRQTIE